VTKASITHDLEQMQAKGFGGAVIIDAGGADQEGNGKVPHGPTFLRRSGASFINTHFARQIVSALK